MILTGPSLSSNFAHNHNHNHGHKTWHTHRDRHKQQQADSSASKQQATERSSLRRPPPPQQPAPQRPHTALMECLANGSSSNGNQKTGSSTLNRLDQLKRSQVSSNTARSSETNALRRNLSSLGHYPGQINGFARNSNLTQRHHKGDSEPIYSPASIASPREFNSIYSTANSERINQSTLYRSNLQEQSARQQAQQHYASASVHNQMSGPSRVQAERPESRASTMLTSRPGSSLGQLLERFGSTLKRQARRHLSRRGRSWSASRRCETPASQIYAPISIAGVPSSTTSRVFGHQHLAAASVSSHSTGSPFTRSSSSRQAPDSGYATSTPPLPAPQPLPAGRPLVMDANLYAALGKRQVTADEIYAEGLRALDCNAERRLLEHQLLVPELMAEGETCTIIEHQSRQQPDYQLLVRQLINWLNDELAERRIIVRDLQDDLHDGQVLCHLVEKFHCLQGSRRLDLVEVTQNETRQRQKLQLALETINRSLRQAPSWPESSGTGSQGGWRQIRWSVEGIHGKNMVQIIQLLVAIVLLHKVPLKLPPNVDVQVLVFQKHHNELLHRTHRVQLTDSSVSNPSQITGPLRAAKLSANDALGDRRDAFDLLLECAPEKLHIVKQSLVRFCNRHLNKINMSCGHGDDLKPENFSDGLLLVFLISSLEDFFVPLGHLFTTVPLRTQAANKLDPLQEEPLQFIDGNNNNTAIDMTYAAIGRPTALEPASFTCSQPVERLHNVHVALQLMEEAGLSDIKQRVRAEEIVNGDLKAVLRVLYALFGRYKHL